MDSSWHCHGAHGLKEKGGNGIARESGRDNGHGQGHSVRLQDVTGDCGRISATC